MDHQNTHRIAIVLAGPTGSGKTYLSTLIAKKSAVEIVSADSRQIYKYMDIGTAKPSKEILEAIPHHFIDILEPDQFYSAGQYGSDARKVIREIFEKNKIPLVVGGSGLYIKALLEGFFKNDVRDEGIRKSLQDRLETEGPESLYQELKKVDEASTQKIHPQNSQRLIRALEVYLASGVPLSHLQQKRADPPDFQTIKFGITKDRKQLYRDIDERVDEMFRAGLLQEVSNLLQRGYAKELNSLNSVGYKEVIQYLDGIIDYDTCTELVKRNSRRYAKRQLTWFKADPEIQWMEIRKPDDYEEACEVILRTYHKTLNARKKAV